MENRGARRRLKIEDQHFWQANLNRRLLDDLTDDKPVIKKEIIVENKLEQEKKLFQELKPGLNQPKSLTKPKQSPTPESSRSSRRDRDRDDVHHRKRRRSDERRRQHQRSTSKDKARYRRRHDSSASSRSPSPRSKENNDDVKKHKMHPEKQQSDKEILYERLEKIKEILKQRNSESEIFMARQRYLQRKQNGEIRAPI
uniref:Uncharacterized protein n=1 Tax=Panagrolaimus sp. PS1159 TaxID=55785 RepID=A0AC35GNZ5_9BILA